MPSKVKKRGEDSYLLTVCDGYDATGKQIVYTKTVTAAGINEAKELYNTFLSECLQGKVLPAGTEKMTLIEFRAYWKEHYANEHHASTTRAVDEDIFTRIEAALGHMRLNKIEPKHILAFYAQLKAPDASHKDTPLSQAYIRKHASLLKTLLSAAKSWKFITENPCDDIKLPKAGRSKKKIPKEAEVKAFFAALSDYPILKHRLWVMLAFSLGLRREEIFGLKWQEVDFDKRTITIALAAVYIPKQGIEIKDTKTDNSYRKLSLPPDIVMMLQEWRDEVKAAAKRRAKRNKVVLLDDPVAPEKWVFPQSDGTVGHPHGFNNFLRAFCEKHNLSLIGPHVFRHLSGSYLLKAGIDIAAVSAKLGHSDKGFTMKTYIHELQSAEEASAIVMQSILDGLKPKENQETKKGQA